jgi:hypothetical protein
METIESVILAPTSVSVVRERLLNVLAAAAFGFHKPGMEGFRSTWQRVRPPNKPEDGIPFDMQDSMFDLPMSTLRTRTPPNPTLTVTSLNWPPLPHVRQQNSRRQGLEHGRGDRNRSHRDPSLPQPPRGEAISPPPREDMQVTLQIFNECDAALCNTRILNEALTNVTPDAFRSNSVIKA